MIQPYLPIYHDSQAQYYNIKKTSWKNAKKFIKHLDKAQIVKSKDRNGNETVIFDIDFEDQQVTHFQPYKPPQKRRLAPTAPLGRLWPSKPLYDPLRSLSLTSSHRRPIITLRHK
jgi:translation initiation factor 2D